MEPRSNETSDLVKHLDPVTGRIYGSRHELDVAMADRQALVRATAEKTQRAIAAHKARELAEKETWGEIEPGRCVLIDADFSRRINPRTWTSQGAVELDGLVEEISGDRAKVRVHYLQQDKFMPTAQMVWAIPRSRLKPLEHPFTWWRSWDLASSAAERSRKYSLRDRWREDDFNKR